MIIAEVVTLVHMPPGGYGKQLVVLRVNNLDLSIYLNMLLLVCVKFVVLQLNYLKKMGLIHFQSRLLKHAILT